MKEKFRKKEKLGAFGIRTGTTSLADSEVNQQIIRTAAALSFNKDIFGYISIMKVNLNKPED